MPSWNIHLEAGERLADKLRLDSNKRREFLLGCILPDINNGYINNPAIVKEHSTTHYAYDKKSSLNFYAENKRQVDAKNPIYLGYIFHLFMDGYFNYDFYHRVKHDPRFASLSEDDLAKMKHHDLWIYDDKLHHEIPIEESEYTSFVNLANQINPVEICEKDLGEVLRILCEDVLNDIYRGEPYQFYTEDNLKDLINQVVEGFSEQYLGEDYA